MLLYAHEVQALNDSRLTILSLRMFGPGYECTAHIIYFYYNW